MKQGLLACAEVITLIFNSVVKYFTIIWTVFFKPCKTISDDVILITGGGRGIGRQLALHFATHKPKQIILWGRNEVKLVETQLLVQEQSVNCTYYVCDVSCKEQIFEKAELVRQEVGAVTILVNNAGVVYGKQITQATEAGILNTLRVNVLAHIWTTKAFLPGMISSERGHIVCMSSMLGLLGLKGTADYTASKFATTGMMESLMQEVDEYPDLHTTIIHPYQVDNEMFAGCRIRFPRLFSPLTEEYVSRESVKAVLTNRKQLLMPAYFHVVLILRSILPVQTMLPVLKFMGLDRAMDTFGSQEQTQVKKQC